MPICTCLLKSQVGVLWWWIWLMLSWIAQRIAFYSEHLHLFFQDHGGLAFTSSFCFESAIRFTKNKAHGTRYLGSQIAFWTDVDTIVPRKQLDLSSPKLIDEIHSDNPLLNRFRDSLIEQLNVLKENVSTIKLFLRFKDIFSTYHSLIYDRRFTCSSHVVSYLDDNRQIQHGRVVLFYSCDDVNYSFIQKYHAAPIKVSNFLDIPVEWQEKMDSFYPVCQIVDQFTIIKTADIVSKCISIPFQQYQCITDRRVQFEHDWTFLNFFLLVLMQSFLLIQFTEFLPLRCFQVRSILIDDQCFLVSTSLSCLF